MEEAKEMAVEGGGGGGGGRGRKARGGKKREPFPSLPNPLPFSRLTADGCHAG